MVIKPFLWKDKTILVTGHTGFKGAWLAMLLKNLGAKVIGLSLPPEKDENLYKSTRLQDDLFDEYLLDISEHRNVKKILARLNLHYIFHLAAQPLVRESIRNPIETFSTNIMGTANIMEAILDQSSIIGATIATTDKVYRNKNTRQLFKEHDALGGSDPYSASKASVEHLVNAMTVSCNPRKIPIATVRAGNVIGGGDWGQDRLVPDIVDSIQGGIPLKVRNPEAERPWQYVLDCLIGYLFIAQKHFEESSELYSTFNLGPKKSIKVRDLINLFEKAFEKKIIVEYTSSQISEHKFLNLNSSLAQNYLGWQTFTDIKTSVLHTANWYTKYYSNFDPRDLVFDEILNYKEGKW